MGLAAVLGLSQHGRSLSHFLTPQCTPAYTHLGSKVHQYQSGRVSERAPHPPDGSHLLPFAYAWPRQTRPAGRSSRPHHNHEQKPAGLLGFSDETSSSEEHQLFDWRFSTFLPGASGTCRGGRANEPVSNRIQTALRGRADKIGTAAPIERSLLFALHSNKSPLKPPWPRRLSPNQAGGLAPLTHRVATTIAYSPPATP